MRTVILLSGIFIASALGLTLIDRSITTMVIILVVTTLMDIAEFIKKMTK